MKTYSTKAGEVERKWHVLDASGQTLGRFVTRVAVLLMGKHKPYYVPYIDTGDYVVVLNASKIKVTGNKAKDKLYHRHSGYHSGLTSVSFEKMIATHPERIIEHAVKGMLPHNRLGRAMYKKLKVYAGNTHPHEAQVRGSSKAKEGSEHS